MSETVRMRSRYSVGSVFDDAGDWDVRDSGKAIRITLIRKPWDVLPLTGRCDVGESRLLSPRCHGIERLRNGVIAIHPFRGGGLQLFQPIEGAAGITEGSDDDH